VVFVGNGRQVQTTRTEKIQFDEVKLGISMWVIHEEAGKEDKFEYDYLKQAREDGEKEVYNLSISALLEGVSLYPNRNERNHSTRPCLPRKVKHSQLF
jgi:hypothetical protein